MKVYILTFDNYDYRGNVGIYTDKKTAVLKAKKAQKALYPQYNFFWYHNDYICDSKECMAEWSIEERTIQQ